MHIKTLCFDLRSSQVREQFETGAQKPPNQLEKCIYVQPIGAKRIFNYFLFEALNDVGLSM